MAKESIVRITMAPCPKCGSKSYKYNPPDVRSDYKGKVIVGKYGCFACGEQVN